MKKKILTLFLAFAIMMTFMPSMAFAVTVIQNVDINVTCDNQGNLSTTWTDASSGHDNTPHNETEVAYIFYSDSTTVAFANENGVWKSGIDGVPRPSAPQDFSQIDHVIVQGALNTLPIEICDTTKVSNATINGVKVAENKSIEGVSTGNVDNNNQFAVVFSSLPIDEATKINFYMYYQFPKAISDVCVGFTAPETVNDQLVIDTVDCNDYNMTSTVFDVNGVEWINPQFKEGDYTIRFIFEALGSNYFAANGNNTEYLGTINGNAPSEFGKSWLTDSIDGLASGALEGNKAKYLIVEAPFTVGNGNSGIKLSGIVKTAAVIAGVAAVVGVAATVVKNVQKVVVAQQMALQAQMQQKAVQKQAAAITTVLKGAGVVLSLAQFGSSLRNLFAFNQFGYNPFGFR